MILQRLSRPTMNDSLKDIARSHLKGCLWDVAANRTLLVSLQPHTETSSAEASVYEVKIGRNGRNVEGILDEVFTKHHNACLP